MRACRRCRSIRDLLLLATAVSLLSLYITYQLGGPLVDTTPTQGPPPWLSAHRPQGESRRGVLARSHDGFGSRLERLLEELEETLIQSRSSRPRLALIRGQKGIMTRDLPLYQRALLGHGFTVRAPASYHGGHLVERNGTVFYTMEDESPGGRAGPALTDWTLLLCMSFTDGDSGNCLDKASYLQLLPHQKVNRIPGIRNSLWRKDGFCMTMMEARQLPAVRKSHLTPLCFLLPGQAEQFLHVADALGEDAHWLVKPLTPGGGLELLDSLDSYGKLRIREYSKQRPVLVQQLFPHPLLVFGSPVSLRVYVLVTAVSPLRAYLYSEGLVHFRHDHARGFHKVVGRTWLLSQLWHYVARNHGQHAVRSAVLSLQAALVQTLLIAETSIAAHLAALPAGEKRYRCQHCFQLLGFDLIFNSSFHAVVLEVNGQPNLQETGRDDGWAANSVKRNLLDSALELLYPSGESASVAKEVAEALDETTDNTGIMGLNCVISHDLCLAQDDLLYLLATRKEAETKAGFRQLYPALGAERYTGLVHDLDFLLTSQRGSSLSASTVAREASRHSTAELHSLMNRLERYYSRRVADDDYSDTALEDAALWGNMNLSNVARGPEDLPEDEGIADKSSTRDLLARPPCSEDPLTMPYLLSIHADPPLILTPAFSALVVDYVAHVQYNQLLVTLWAFAQNCQSEVRLDDKFGPSQPANYTLGLGDNRLAFLVVDIRHSEPWVINTYTLMIHRPAQSEREPPFDPKQAHEVCGIKQECELRVVPGESRGLQKESATTWAEHVTVGSNLPSCSQGDAPGRWILPCSSCSDRQSCFWREAAWAPLFCRYPPVSQPALAECLAGKKLLFIGDSTNRGIMHYLMERLNGTLSEGDKTHHIRVHDNLNSGRTAFSFAYYPQFWLPTHERPVFDKALYQLIQRSRPLENSNNTVLVVGGLHWLATQHLHMLLRALRRENLQAIRLVMKTLGSGFHLPVEGVHCLSQVEQRKLMLHSRGLSEFAKHYGFEVVDTFNITIPRFRDFLQGKCACHFHRVVPVQNEANSRHFRYHVEGPVNAVYSEILISRLCGEYSNH